MWLSKRFRGGKTRTMYKELKLQRKQRNSSILLIQCFIRMRMSRKIARRLREKRWALVSPHASTIIQRHWRGILGRRKASSTRTRILQQLQHCLMCTIRIQAWARTILAKRVLVLLRCRHFTRELKRFRSSITIHCFWRRYLAKAILTGLQLEFNEQEQLRIASLSRISALVRCRLFRKTIQKRVLRTQRRLDATLLIQSWFRNETERVRQRILAEKKLAELRVSSARILQRNIRRRLAYLELLRLRSQQNELEALREAKARVLCHWGRSCVAKLRVQQRRVEYEKELKQSLLLMNWAATTIASAFRGKLGRDRAKGARIAQRQRWKALYDNNHQCAFYYNQDTGETRWEKPQILLDAEPKPTCSNCNEYQGEFECLECEEFFCTHCWEFIHKGGRRAKHSFRTVYDYYGKRKDYDREPWLTKECEE